MIFSIYPEPGLAPFRPGTTIDPVIAPGYNINNLKKSTEKEKKKKETIAINVGVILYWIVYNQEYNPILLLASIAANGWFQF